MNMTENANLIEGLRRVGFSDTQIADLQLMIEGRISMEDWEKRYSEAKADSQT